MSKKIDISRLPIYRLSPIACPPSVYQYTTRLIFIQAFGGIPPYTYKYYVDGFPIISYQSYETTFGFGYTYNDTIADHTYTSEIIDNCPTTISESCIISVMTNPCTPPTCTFALN